MSTTNRLRMAALALCAGFLSLSAVASTTADLVKTRTPKGKPVVLGKWHAGFDACLSYAKKNNVPIIAVWSNGDNCGHCITFEKAIMSATFTKWMKNSGCVFFFVTGSDADGRQGGAAFQFAKGVSEGGKTNPYGIFPYVRLYWSVNGKKKVDAETSGDYIDGKKRGDEGGKLAVDWFSSRLMAYKPQTPDSYTGGEFPYAEKAQSRLEAEAGVTDEVVVPLSRTNKTTRAKASTNYLVVTTPDGRATTNKIAWAAGASSTSFTVDTSVLTNAGDRITLTLLDSSKKSKYKRYITAVQAENSPKNPLWLGERTKDTLDWGEWTMDLDAVTNKVKEANGGSPGAGMLSAQPRLLQAPPQNAYSLVLVGGSMWCPDCSSAEYHFFGNTNFINWAKAKHVALAAIDIPNLPSGKSSLLTRTVSETSDRYVTYNNTPGRKKDESLRYQSGNGYISRHMIPMTSADGITNATAVAARNAALVGTDTKHGGWNRPESTRKERTGVPILIALRDDGTIAGRFTRYSVSGPTAWEPGTLKRLEEIFDQIAEPAEEANDSYTTTPESIGFRTNITGRTISFTDAQDVYRLTAETVGKRMNFTMKGTNNVQVEVKVLSSDGTVKASDHGSLVTGVSVDCKVSAANWFVAVGPYKKDGYPVSSFFAHTNLSSTVCEYGIETDFVALPTDVEQTVEIDDWEKGMTISLVSNEVYRITGIDDANGSVLEPVEGVADHYRALVTDVTKLTLSSSTVKFQYWHPGNVGFTTTSAFVAEAAATYTIRLHRREGVSGTARLKLSFDESQKAYKPELIKLPENFGDELVWLEGSNDVKTITLGICENKYADGDVPLMFTCATNGVCDATNGISQLKITLRDNDMRVPGTIAIGDSAPPVAKNRTVFLRAGDPLEITLVREGGADGDLAADLQASAGELDKTTFAWPGRDATNKTATLTGTVGLEGKTISVTLTPAKGTVADSFRRTLSVSVLGADVPGFAEGAKTITAMRYIPIEETTIDLDEKADDATTVKKFSGTLASGLTWKLENGKLVFAGVPTKAGRTTAVFRAYNGDTPGLVTAVTVDVTDPVLTGGGDENAPAPLNASVAISRTFADLSVFDKATNRLAGVLTLTLPRTGRASAKYRTLDGTVSLSAKSWDAIAADGTLSVSLVGTSAGKDYALDVDAAADGTVAMALTDPACPDGVTCLASGVAWSANDRAADFRGYYTVSLPVKEVLSGAALAKGAGYVTLKMNTAQALNAGTFEYAGLLPNGKPFSGTAHLAAAGWSDEHGCWTRGVLPMLVSGTSDALAGALCITPGAADPKAADLDAEGAYCNGRCSYTACRRSVRPAAENDIVYDIAWRHVEKVAAVSYEASLDAFGTYYYSKESFAACCENALATTMPKFFSLGGLGTLPTEAPDPDPGEGDDPEEADPLAFKNDGAATVGKVSVTYTAKTKTNGMAAKNSSSQKLTLSFAASTGLVSGTFPLTRNDGKVVTMSYKGVVMPGWGSFECTTCGEGGVEAALRPFISGTAWFDDTFTYEVNGAVRSLKVRRACPFSVGVNPGE